MHFLAVGLEKLGREVVGSSNDGHLLGVVAKADSGSSPHIADFKIEGLF